MRKSLVILALIAIIIVTIIATAILVLTVRKSLQQQDVIPSDIASILKSASKALVVYTTSFSNGSRIPSKYSYCDGNNVSPEIIIENVPQNAKSVILIVYDPDAPKGVFYHWIVYGLKGSKIHLPEGASRTPELLQGVNSYGFVGYGGPCPPPGDKPHRYVFLALATDVDTSEWSSGLRPEEVLSRLNGHVISYGFIYGTYSR
jgi:hypothetical protein